MNSILGSVVPLAMFLQTLRLSQFDSLFNLDISPGQGQQGNVEDQNLQVAWALLYHSLLSLERI